VRIYNFKISTHVVWIVSAVAFKILMLSYVYNTLVDEEHIYHIAHGKLLVQMQKREVLNKQASDVVRSYVATEKMLYDRTIVLHGLLRVGAIKVDAMKEIKSTQDEISGLLAKLSALREAAPQLSSMSPYLYLMATYRRTEQDVLMARFDYNSAVDEYNTVLNEFPTKIISRAFDFKNVEFFVADKDAETAPSVADIRRASLPDRPASKGRIS
jgi:LemA protein